MIESEPGYIFNIREYKENSVILSVLTLNYGHVSVMARGAHARSILQPFTPLKLSLSPSKTDMYFLQDVECCGETYSFKLPILFCATYLNELLYHLYHSKDANPILFGTYVATLEALQQQQHVERHLRIFELTLLECLGYGLSSTDQDGVPLQNGQLYRFGIGMGFIKVQAERPENTSKRAFLNTISRLNAEASQASLAQTANPQDAIVLTQAVNTSQPVSTLALNSSESQNQEANTNSVSNWSDEELESAMRFSKRKVKGPSITSHTSASLDSYQQQYSGLVTNDGRPISLSELLGPALPGDVLSKIIAHKFDADVLKQSKLLTNALFQFLLGKREIKSRQMYRDYLQLQAQGKAKAQVNPSTDTGQLHLDKSLDGQELVLKNSAQAQVGEVLNAQAPIVESQLKEQQLAKKTQAKTKLRASDSDESQVASTSSQPVKNPALANAQMPEPSESLLKSSQKAVDKLTSQIAEQKRQTKARKSKTTNCEKEQDSSKPVKSRKKSKTVSKSSESDTSNKEE